MTHYDSLWLIMTHYDSLWLIMTHYDSLWLILPQQDLYSVDLCSILFHHVPSMDSSVGLPSIHRSGHPSTPRCRSQRLWQLWPTWNALLWSSIHWRPPRWPNPWDLWSRRNTSKAKAWIAMPSDGDGWERLRKGSHAGTLRFRLRFRLRFSVLYICPVHICTMSTSSNLKLLALLFVSQFRTSKQLHPVEHAVNFPTAVITATPYVERCWELSCSAHDQASTGSTWFHMVPLSFKIPGAKSRIVVWFWAPVDCRPTQVAAGGMIREVDVANTLQGFSLLETGLMRGHKFDMILTCITVWATISTVLRWI